MKQTKKELAAEQSSFMYKYNINTPINQMEVIT